MRQHFGVCKCISFAVPFLSCRKKLSCTLHETSIFAIAPENRINCSKKNWNWKTDSARIIGNFRRKTRFKQKAVFTEAIAFLSETGRKNRSFCVFFFYFTILYHVIRYQYIIYWWMEWRVNKVKAKNVLWTTRNKKGKNTFLIADAITAKNIIKIC